MGGICHGKTLSSPILIFSSSFRKKYFDICKFTLPLLYMFLHLKVNQEPEEICMPTKMFAEWVFMSVLTVEISVKLL